MMISSMPAHVHWNGWMDEWVNELNEYIYDN